MKSFDRMRNVCATSALLAMMLMLQACGANESSMSQWWYDQRWESAAND